VLDDVTSTTLSTALHALSLQQRVSADNLSNLETPGYTANRVDFADSLRDAVASGNPQSMQITSSKSADAAGTNGNNVRLDEEIIIEEKTGQQYQLLSTAMSAKFDLISTVIKG
jgi:flagellar basal-body rod protein FlgB